MKPAAAVAALHPAPATGWIERIFPGLPPGGFDGAYPGRPFLAAGPPSRFEFSSDERLLVPELTITSSPCPPLHTAFIPAGSGGGQVRCTRDEAVQLFREGCTISLEAGGKIHEGLEQLAAGLAEELAVERVISPAISVSPAGVGTPVHFDGLEVIVVQLAGSKRWRIAANSQVESPDFPFFPGEQGAGARGGRVSTEAVRLEPPSASELQTLVLEPGSALFLPRGWWHETQALEDSISMTVRLPLETAYFAVATEIVRRLREHARWRQVLALRPGASRRRPSEADLAGLVRDAVAELQARDVYAQGGAS